MHMYVLWRAFRVSQISTMWCPFKAGRAIARGEVELIDLAALLDVDPLGLATTAGWFS